jgi:dihydrolipoamide dehydrogenase
VKKLQGLGVEFVLNASFEGVVDAEGKKAVKVKKADGTEAVLPADRILVAVGHKANTSGLGLENTGVKLDERGFVKVDERMRTDDHKIYAIGDVVGGPLLAHKASRQGKVAAEAASGLESAYHNRVVPAVVYCDPEIASAGMGEEEAFAKGLKYVVGKFPFRALGRSLTRNDTDGFVKIVAEKETGVVLGVHIVGAEAGELISEAALGIEMGAVLEDLASTIHPHPTLPEALMEAAEAAQGKAIHIFQGELKK